MKRSVRWGLYLVFLAIVTAPLTIPGGFYLWLRWDLDRVLARDIAELDDYDRAMLDRVHYVMYWRYWDSYQRVCVNEDPLLLYRPREGPCRFSNVEFDTTVTHEKGVRKDHRSEADVNILLIGDSHAMGWGVEDLETFAAVLERDTGYNLDNMSVASWGTARELLAAEERGVENYDLMLIAYCPNDLSENLAFLGGRYTLPRPSYETRENRDYTLYSLPHVPGYVRRLWTGELRRGFAEARRAREVGFELPPNNATSHRQNLDRILTEFSTRVDLPPIIATYFQHRGQRFENWETVEIEETYPGVTYVDVQPPPDLWYPLDGHMLPEGHEEVARRLRPILEEALSMAQADPLPP